MFDIGRPWPLALALALALAIVIGILLVASIGYVDDCVQVCSIQFANDLATWNTPRTDRQLTLLAKAGMVVFIVAASAFSAAGGVGKARLVECWRGLC